MNNPFDYEPSPLMLEEKKRLTAHIEEICRKDNAFAEEIAKGKMYGILVCEERVLAAFSGQIGGRYDWEGFVPAVFDYLDEDGYFKTHEREISALNRQIASLEQSPRLLSARERYRILAKESKEDIALYREKMRKAKAERDMLRSQGLKDDEELIRESQFMKAELHRKKVMWKERLSEAGSTLENLENEIRSMKMQRSRKSDALQRWLFGQFVFTNPDTDERKNLLQIFDEYYRFCGSSLAAKGALPPSGAGECCEPKLLHYALAHHLHPIEMGMFWWGDSPRGEVRHHDSFYPACNGKCKPILEFLGVTSLRSDPLSPSLSPSPSRTITILYSDPCLLIVGKPSGLLSVPGKDDAPSVLSLLERQFPGLEFLMVHRLDQDTSGLLVVAKNREVHKDLQQQFASHTISKEYIAILEKPLTDEVGEINLPLAPDYEDRPRQRVDFEVGKQAVTRFKAVQGDSNLVRLFPLTGRTHQLRVHCAHRLGLDNPIKGDRLYGKKADRLYLHAYRLEFTHPVTNKRMTFEAPCPFLNDKDEL